ncbi:POTRA domain-containing protein [Chondromyces apiculatus]|uniref:POTRA domain-containing protein n=1 Tax=Chondromyces apiculatus DSM 436 TaxID=1192034 RepID=A0A017SW45_9BACT|nr:POTRA domain-containing protein [Chondromyces apiculatus]EYF00977.1 Hypothetical protein CAP_8845 [Chondromyces apiculatus DSM 436]
MLAVLALAGRPTRAEGPPGVTPSAGQRTPAQQAVLGAEDLVQGADTPALEPLPSLGDLAGKPIAPITVTAVGGRWPRVEPITSVELDEPLSADSARRALKELLATGSYARASAEVVANEEGVELRLFVLPRRLVATVQMTGAALGLAPTLEAARIAEGSEVTAPMLVDIRARIRAFYAQHGYTAAQVDVDAADTDDPMRVVLDIDIVPGPPRAVTQRVFVIDPAADREIGSLKQRYRFGSGDRVDEPAFTEADQEMVELLRKEGFHRADVLHRVVHVGPRSYLYVYLTPGPRILPAFEGNRAFDAVMLEDALELDGETEHKPAELLERLRTFYVRRGFLDVEIRTEERKGTSDTVVYQVFIVRENAQVRVTKRVFPCLTGTLGANDIGAEIQTFLEEDLPGGEFITLPDIAAVDSIFGPTQGAGGRARPADLNPAMTYDRETYERALSHIRDLYYAKGYLNAIVGPVSPMRATCSRLSPPGQCIPESPRVRVSAQCRTDEYGLPLPEAPVPDALMCQPDPAHGVECAPEITLRIPIQPGPQTTLYDLAFEGNRAFPEQALAQMAELTLGQPLSTLDMDAARLRLLDAYRDLGYAYAEVHATVEPSPDRTRARVRFVITERERVFVTGFVIKGAVRTDHDLILRRLALRKNEPFGQKQARTSEERIATLGPFASVSVSLEDPDVPQKNKRVVITVAEQLPQYLDPRIGFSTGEGLRFAVEYGHRNIGGAAVSLTLRLQLNYLFDFMILDSGVQANYASLTGLDRLERRNNVSVVFPEIGLGPLVSLSLDAIDVRDNQRDFGLTKQAVIPALTYRPRRTLNSQLGLSAELNDVGLFNEDALDRTISLLRVPQGRTIALAQQISLTWDGRDSPFAATKGALLSGSVEHVNAFPATTGKGAATINSHFLRLTGRVAGYIPLPLKGVSIALSMSAGYNRQLTGDSQTYPDRLFFLGGVDSLRAFLVDALVPQDVAERILRGDQEDAQGGLFTIEDVPIRGGDLALNPRVELRFPLGSGGVLQGGLFLDTGNLWAKPENFNPFEMRYAAGAGLRIGTPIGPLALDYGINLIRRPWEDFGAFQFSIGLF